MDLKQKFQDKKLTIQAQSALQEIGEIVNDENLFLMKELLKENEKLVKVNASTGKLVNAKIQEDIIFTDVDDLKPLKKVSNRKTSLSTEEEFFGYRVKTSGGDRFGILVYWESGDHTKYTTKECQNEIWVKEIKDHFQNNPSLWDENKTKQPLGKAQIDHYLNPTSINPKHLSIERVKKCVLHSKILANKEKNIVGLTLGTLGVFNYSKVFNKHEPFVGWGNLDEKFSDKLIEEKGAIGERIYNHVFFNLKWENKFEESYKNHDFQSKFDRSRIDVKTTSHSRYFVNSTRLDKSTSDVWAILFVSNIDDHQFSSRILHIFKKDLVLLTDQKKLESAIMNGEEGYYIYEKELVNKL